MGNGQIWANSGNDWYPGNISSTVEDLPVAVYILEIEDMTGAWSLKRQSDQFTFDFKVYGLESDLIKRVTTYYNSTSGDVGVLLNGVKGTGKTITAKILANKLENPIIIVTGKSSHLTSIFNEIKCDITVVIDEFEKSFGGKNPNEGDASLLSIMDGTIQSEYRRVWILTTNNLYINENLLNRPGRIRYKKHFGDLDLDTIYEVLDDILLYPEFREDIVDYCKSLKIITVDILKTIVNEVNIFNEAPQDCCKVINVEVKADEFNFINMKTREVLKGEFGIQTTERIRKSIAEGKPNLGGFNKFISNTSYDEYTFIKELEDGTYLYSCVKEGGNGNSLPATMEVCGFECQKFVHNAFAY